MNLEWESAMLIFRLLSAASSFSRTVDIDSYSSLEALPDYGFNPGGLFSFQLTGLNVSGVVIHLASYAESGSHTLPSSFYMTMCHQASNFDPRYIHSFHSGSDTWIGHVFETGIFAPIVANCRSFSFAVHMSARNAHSWLDIRSSFVPYTYAGFSLLYPTFAFAMVANGLLNFRFHIRAHSALTCSILFRAASIYASGRLWLSRIESEEVQWESDILVAILSICSLSTFFTINALLLSGWGTYRDRVEHSDWLPLLNLTFVFFFMKMLATRETSWM
jgi:hypothetical protein